MCKIVMLQAYFGSRVLKASPVECQLIPSKNTLNQTSIDTSVDTELTSQSTAG